MRRCPKCDATTETDDVFCETDGARLIDPAEHPAVTIEAPRMSDPAIVAVASQREIAPTLYAKCPACGAAEPDEGDGYCSSCGHRLAGNRATPPLIPIGAKIAGSEVIAARAADDFVVRGPHGELTVAIGSVSAVAAEAAALAALGGVAPFPKLVEHGDDPRHGSFVAMASPPASARRLADVAPTLSLDAALTLLQRVLDAAEAVERAGFDWLPEHGDLWVLEDGTLTSSRLRGALLLSKGSHLDARALCEAIGVAFLPEPLIRTTPRLLRALVAHRLVDPDANRTVDDLRAEIIAAAARAAATPPPHDRALGALCDGGLKRDHNEDACAVATGETNGDRWTVLVVCDGVSSSTRAEEASAIASKTACDALAHFARSGDLAFEAATAAMSQAIRAAHLAVCATKIDHAGAEPPGTTIVAGFVYRRRLTVGWVGDSRAYWVSTTGAELLTRDHSWANEAVARGEMTEAEAMRAPLAHALTKCLGPLEVGDIPHEIEPEVRARDLPGPGHIVLCSDGLWNYFPSAVMVAELVRAAGRDAHAESIARQLVNHALARGGGDNVTVAVFAHELS